MDKTMQTDVITIADTCVDLVLTGDVVPEFGQKEKLVDHYAILLGGSGAIFSCQAAKLKLTVAPLGKVGQDVFGKLVLDELQESGVDMQWMSVCPITPTALTALLTTPDDRAMLTHNLATQAISYDDVTDTFLRQGKHLHYCSYFLLEGIRPRAVDILRRAKSFGLTTSMDTNWDPAENWDDDQFREALRYIDILLPNENELMALAGRDNLPDALDLMAGLVDTVVVKQGSQGAMLRQGSKTIRINAFPVDVKDTIGAGDSFDAGFVYAFLRGYSPEDSLKIAAACGALSTQAHGGTAAQGHLHEVLELALGK